MVAPLAVPFGSGTPGSTAHPRHLSRSKAPRLLHPRRLAAAVGPSHKYIDVSGYQRGINLPPIFAAGVDGVICKATEGTSYYNGDLPRVIGQARDGGKIGAAYHFLRPGQGKQQADYFLSKTAGLIRPGTRMILDVEAGTHDDAHAFTTEVMAAGWDQMLYTGGWFWNGLGAATCQHCAGFPLWESSYTAAQPSPLRPWSSVALWQYTDRATVPGWGSGVDMSVTSNPSALLGSAPLMEDPLMALSDTQANNLVTDAHNAAQIASDVRNALNDPTNGVLARLVRMQAAQDPAAIAAAVAAAMKGQSADVDVDALAKAIVVELGK